MSVLRWIYLGLTILGMLQFVLLTLEVGSPWIATQLLWDFRIEPLYNDKTGDGSALAFELAIATVALFVWALAETWVRKNWWALSIIPVTLVVGLSCGLPLYLFLRTRPIV